MDTLDTRPAHVRSRDGFAGFDSWDAVLAFCAAADADCSYPDLWYHAPLDVHPVRVRVVRVFKNRKIRIDPLSNQADNFTADAGHLNRMLRRKPVHARITRAMAIDDRKTAREVLESCIF